MAKNADIICIGKQAWSLILMLTSVYIVYNSFTSTRQNSTGIPDNCSSKLERIGKRYKKQSGILWMAPVTYLGWPQIAMFS